MSPNNLDSWMSELPRRPLVMGVLNVTPDSFSDGGTFASSGQAVASALAMIEAGADWIDVGGESTRPGAGRVGAEEQIRRVEPVIHALRRESDAVISIDTTLASVGEAALKNGANVVNDVSAGRDDPEMFHMVARHKCGMILMHMQGTPATMQENPTYKDVTAEVAEFLLQQRDAAAAAGVSPGRILLDPGLGFGKTLSHNIRLMADVPVLASLGHPLVIGPSRKSFIGRMIGEKNAADRVFGTAAACAMCVDRGASVVRVHDVLPVVQTLRVVQGINFAKMPDFLKE